jgi:hypothetical protein
VFQEPECLTQMWKCTIALPSHPWARSCSSHLSVYPTPLGIQSGSEGPLVLTNNGWGPMDCATFAGPASAMLGLKSNRSRDVGKASRLQRDDERGPFDHCTLKHHSKFQEYVGVVCCTTGEFGLWTAPKVFRREPTEEMRTPKVGHPFTCSRGFYHR